MSRLWNALSIRSKLTFMMLLTSLIGAGLIIAIGFVSGNEAMSAQVTERLVAVRSAKAFEIEQYLRNVANQVLVEASERNTATAVAEFTEAFRLINDTDTVDCGRELNDWYNDYLDDLNRSLDVRQDISTFYPRTSAGCYLQTQYIVRNPYPAVRRGDLDLAPDNSTYSDVHARYNAELRRFRETFGFYDVFLVDATGTIVYTVAKEADFATNLTYGPYRTSGLAELFERVRDNADLSATQIVDFTPYRPSYGDAAAFAGAPVLRDGQFLGMLAIQLPVTRINDIMNYGNAWARNGLEQTGETVLVGANDYKLRSLPRPYVVDSAAFVDRMRGNMPEDDWRATIKRGPLLNVKARSPNIERAARGQDSVMTLVGYAGQPVLSAYGPLDLPGGLEWVITAEMDEEEAFAAVSNFGRRMIIGLCFIVVLAVLLALLFTRVFMRPIETLTAGAERVRRGDTSAHVDLAVEDELGHFADVFNNMIDGIAEQKAEIAQQTRANESLLTAKFPPAVAERYRAGEENIVENFDNVTVLFTDLRRTEQLSELEPAEGLHILNTIVREFNELAARLGMEIIRPMADGYLAVCDMNSPRLDNTRRALDMALEMREALFRTNERFNLGLTIATGIEHGNVSAGIIAESTNAYDVWGRAVDIVQRIAAIPDDNIVGVSPTVVELVGDRYAYVPGPTLHLSTGEDLPISLLTGRRAGVPEDPASEDDEDEDDATDAPRRERAGVRDDA